MMGVNWGEGDLIFGRERCGGYTGVGTANLDQIKRDLVCGTNSKRYWQVTTTGYEFPILSQISIIITRGNNVGWHGTGHGVGVGWR